MSIFYTKAEEALKLLKHPFVLVLWLVGTPLVIGRQNRQDRKDRLRSELDFAVNRHAHREIQGLADKLNRLGDRFGDIEDMLRNDTRQKT